MPLELGVWRIDGQLTDMEFAPLDLESRLQDVLANDITVADPNLMVIGREVKTAYDKLIDILAINRDGNLVVLELKRDKTPRDIVAQTLDYGAWVRGLRDDDIASIFDDYLQLHHSARSSQSIDEAFCKHFNVPEMPEELNTSHELVIVASSLDPSTERIVQYLADEYSVNINALFFRCFKDGDREYLCRAWLREPGETADPVSPGVKTQGEWNHEYYVSFGHNDHGRRDWEEARRWGFISAGGGAFYSRTLQMLSPGDRVWVNAPGIGYVGVGTVSQEALRADHFMVHVDGKLAPLTQVTTSPHMAKHLEDDERAEWVVGVDWTHTVPLKQAVKEKGLFGNQNTVARPKTPKWDHTIERLKKRFNVS